ncbi:MAG: signal peptidase I [Christensenellaceae bacterium]|nr:signal peptidase I [Christensenellaceae bacterium]
MRPLRIRSSESNTGLYRFLDWLIAVALGAIAVALLLFVFMTPIVVEEDSIADIGGGELVFADRMGKYFADYGRGDIVVYRYGKSSKTHLGRIVAFSGEQVQVSNGHIYINDAYLDESAYAIGFSDEYSFCFTVPNGKVLILPDDRSSIDGNRIDAMTFSASEIVGEVRFRIYPLNKLELFA